MIYDIAKTMDKKWKKSFDIIKQYLEIESEDKKVLAETKEKLKREKKYVKDNIKETNRQN